MGKNDKVRVQWVLLCVQGLPIPVLVIMLLMRWYT